MTRGENATGIKEEETEGGQGRKRERTVDYCLSCKQILMWTHQHNPT